MYKLIRLSALSGKDTTYALSGSDFLYATVGTDTAGPSLSSIKLTVDELGSYFGDTLVFWNSAGNVITPKSTSAKVGLGTTTNPAATFDVGGTDAIVIPAGTSAQRPSAEQGMVRYNTDTVQFEGHNGAAWTGLGGVIDIDRDTKIQAEESSDEDKLRFDTAGGQRMIIDSNGRVGINIDAPSKLLHVKEASSSVVAISAEGELHVSGDIVAYSTSDLRLKNNVFTIPSPLSTLSRINGVTFEWNDLAPHKDGTDYGVIAQEVEAVLPEAVIERDTGYKAVDYEKLIPLLIESVKELSERVNELESRNYGG